MINEGMTVLDYGCGNGYFSIALSLMVENSGKVYAVDIQKVVQQKKKGKISLFKK